MNTSRTTPPDALLLISTHCAYCPQVLQSLGELVKLGRIGRLEVVNMLVRPDLASHYGVRSVPWIRVDEFELEGMYSRAELEHWLQRAGTAQGLVEYDSELLKQGKLASLLPMVRRNPRHLAALLAIAGDPEADLSVRIGVSALLEDVAGSAPLQQHLPELVTLSNHTDARVRADACHFLALTESPAAVAILEALSDDAVAAVREVARDSLDELKQILQN